MRRSILGALCVISATTLVGESVGASKSTTKCGAQLVDLRADPSNCGACAHDCLGGTCVASACTPVAVAKTNAPVTSIATNASHVFWTTGNGVFRAKKLGGQVDVLATGGHSFAVAADATYAYFRDGGSVKRVPVDGGPEVVLAGPFPSPKDFSGGLALDGDTLYWPQDLVLRMVSTSGGASNVVVDTTVAVMGTTRHPRTLVARGGELDWIQFGKLRHLGASTKGPEDLGMGPGEAGWRCAVIARDAHDLVVFEPQNASVISLFPLPGSAWKIKSWTANGKPLIAFVPAVVPLANGPWLPKTDDYAAPCDDAAIAIEGDHAYAAYEGHLYDVTVNAATKPTLMTSSATGRAVAVDGKSVFFADAYGVSRIAR